MRDALIDLLGEAIGKENVITDNEQAQRVIDEQNGIVRPERVAEVNKMFNEELDEFKDKQLKGGILHLGEPNALLRSSGLKASEITLTAKTLKEHLDKHGISIEEIKDLPNAINNPMMVYEWGTKAKSTIIITNITRESGDKITVAVKLERNGEEMTINEIASIHGKEGQRFISDMINAKEGGIEKALKYIQKDRKEVLDWLGLDAPKASASLTNEELHIAKVLQTFKNPAIIEQKNEKNLKEHRLVGGNSGYVGYSMSKRAEQAREEGRYPKTDFKKVYNISDKTLKALVSAGIIDDNEWHHTSKYGNKTTFYGWSEEKFATIYRLFKKEIDAIVKENQPQPNPYKYTEWNEFSEEFQALPYNVKKDKGSKELQDFLKTHPEDKAKYEKNEKYNQWQAQAPSPIETTRIVSEKLNKFFDEKDVKFFKTKDGEAYGFTVGGKVYVDERIADASTPIHEYTHLWAEALRKVNPKEWQNIVSLMKKQTHLWDKVKNDYPELKTDDEIADEVLAHYSGERGKKLLEEEYKKIRGNNKLNIFDKAKMLQAINNVREALRKFWKGVADFLGIHFTSAEEVADKVLSDLLEGVNPNEVIKEQGLLQGEEKEKAREKLLATEPIEVTPNTIQTKDGKSASRVAMEWVDENQPEPIVAMTEVGEVTIDKRSIKDSLGHGFGQKKLDAITSLGQAFKEKKATYIGAMRDMDGKNQMNYYFAYPITYNGEENFVFCRATKDESKNRLYVHEVFTLDEIQGNSLQPSMSKTQSRGTSLYKNIIADILNAKVQQNSETTKLKLQKVTERVVEKATDKALEEVKDPILKRAYKGILKESTKDKWASFADDYHALRVMEDKVIEEMRKRDPKFRLHHSVYEQQIAAKAATQGQIFLFSQQTFKPLLDKVDKIKYQ